jgi:hypothetical protein
MIKGHDHEIVAALTSSVDCAIGGRENEKK